MSVLLLLVPIALVLGVIWVLAFLWCVRGKQFEDLQGDAARILNDHD